MYGYDKRKNPLFLTREGKFKQILVATLSAAVTFFASALSAATPLQNITLSPDITASLAKTVLNDEDAGQDDLAGSVSLTSLGFIPASSDLNAYHRLNKTDQLVSFDTTLNFSGVIAEPGDVIKVSFNGLAFTYQVIFDASALGIAPGVMVDAIGVRNGDLILSFDTSVSLGFSVDDEDLVRYNEVKGFSKYFDGSDVGLSQALDVDGVHVLKSGNLLLSFDGSGRVGRTAFDDEDILEYRLLSDTWTLIYDGSTEHASLGSADIDALAVTQLDVPACEGDFDGDGDVDGSDLAVFSEDFGRTDCSTGPICEGDFDDDGDVDGTDLAVFSQDFGRTDCP